jgi:hypothetical protein
MKFSLSTIPDKFKGTVLKKLAGTKHLLYRNNKLEIFGAYLIKIALPTGLEGLKMY